MNLPASPAVYTLLLSESLFVIYSDVLTDPNTTSSNACLDWLMAIAVAGVSLYEIVPTGTATGGSHASILRLRCKSPLTRMPLNDASDP